MHDDLVKSCQTTFHLLHTVDARGDTLINRLETGLYGSKISKIPVLCRDRRLESVKNPALVVHPVAEFIEELLVRLGRESLVVAARWAEAVV